MWKIFMPLVFLIATVSNAFMNVNNGDFVQVGDAKLIVGEHLLHMADSKPILDNMEALHQRYEDDGYLFFRGLLNRDKVLDARATLLARLLSLHRIDTDKPVDKPYSNGTFGHFFGSDYAIQTEDTVKTILESEDLYKFFERFFGESAITYAYKWLRAVSQTEFTGAHCDTVYMGRGSQDLMTAWIPFGDIPVENGGMVVNPKSHKLDLSYQHLDVDRDVPNDIRATGHLTNNPLTWAPKPSAKLGWANFDPESILLSQRHVWVSEDFQAGDIVIFGIHTLHMSATNSEPWFRLSCDTRWQPSSHPIDERWKGSHPNDGSEHRFFMGDKPDNYDDTVKTEL